MCWNCLKLVACRFSSALQHVWTSECQLDPFHSEIKYVSTIFIVLWRGSWQCVGIIPGNMDVEIDRKLELKFGRTLWTGIIGLRSVGGLL
jgi:hypothetical protein